MFLLNKKWIPNKNEQNLNTNAVFLGDCMLSSGDKTIGDPRSYMIAANMWVCPSVYP